MTTSDQLVELLATHREHAALLLDFDGTLTPIVDDPDEASLSSGEIELLEAIAQELATTAIVSGRPGTFLHKVLRFGARDASKLLVFGRNGLDIVDPSGSISAVPTSSAWTETMTTIAERARNVATTDSVEEKGEIITLHWRRAQSQEPALRAFALESAANFHIELREGKMSIDLFPPGTPSKQSTVRRLAANCAAVVFIGDDVGDLEAFNALDEIAETRTTVRVAVSSNEAPQELLTRADLVLDSPTRVQTLLRQLKRALENV